MKLAEKADLSLAQVSLIERQKAWVSIESLWSLAHAFGVPETALFFDPDTEWTMEDLATLVTRMARKQSSKR